MTKALRYLFAALLPTLVACNPEDRSSEQPFAPVVQNSEIQVIGDSCLLSGEVISSPNSSLKACGFRYGNDTLRTETLSEVPLMKFQAYTKQLQPGNYYAVAFAQNGVGKSYAPDTVYFTIPE